ncbi:Alcohol dehydrogenase 9 [Linum perenne]
MAKASPEDVHPVKAFGWAANDPSGRLSPFRFSRRATGEEDVRFKVLYCGICHSDLHCIKNEWGFTTYPIIPGTCENCTDDLENHCPKVIQTYNSINHDGTMTYGGYSDHMVANQRYIVRMPENMPLDAGAPLLCAGITVYSPLKYYGLDKPGMHVGVVGLGGLGHVGVKFAKAMGARVMVISTSPKKEEEALKRLGADSFLVSSRPDQLQKAQFTLDGIIDTVSAVHPLLPLLSLLKPNGKLILVGAPEKPLELPAFSVIMGRKTVAGSNIGGMKETQEMIDFAAKHNITADIEVIKAEDLNTAMARLVKGDVRYRFVIDVGNTMDATKK